MSCSTAWESEPPRVDGDFDELLLLHLTPQYRNYSSISNAMHSE